ncbi:MAG: hypothetical protein PGN11_21575 [Quadrisphaera sp.]
MTRARPVTAAPASLLQTSASGLPFMLGAAGDGVASGEYERQLGRRLDLTATWADSTWASTHLPVLQAGGGAGGGGRGALDVSVGAFGAGTTWAQARGRRLRRDVDHLADPARPPARRGHRHHLHPASPTR